MAFDLDRIIVRDYVGLGNLFIDWATGAKQRPADLDGFKAAVGDLIQHYPDYLATLEMVQTKTITNLLVRLPPADLVNDTIKHIGDPYTLPTQLYDRKVADNRAFFGGRVGDYTISQCS